MERASLCLPWLSGWLASWFCVVHGTSLIMLVPCARVYAPWAWVAYSVFSCDFAISKLNYKNVVRMIDIQRHALLSTCSAPFSNWHLEPYARSYSSSISFTSFSKWNRSLISLALCRSVLFHLTLQSFPLSHSFSLSCLFFFGLLSSPISCMLNVNAYALTVAFVFPF